MTRATERAGSAPSSWAATPETCGAAMLVPLMVVEAVLLEPTYAARIPEPGACAHGGGGSTSLAGPRTRADVWQAECRCGGKTHMHAGVGAGAGGKTLPKQASGGGDLHVDASAVV